MTWCPKCHYKTVLAHFPDERCPQCGSIVTRLDELHDDPYHPEVGARYGLKRSAASKKKFVAEHEESSGDLKSRTVDPTFGIKGRI